MTAKSVTILGAGIVGLTSAHALAEAGYKVHVIETADAPATGASQSNGFQLSYGYLAPPFTFWEVARRFKSMLCGTNPQTTIAHVKRRELIKQWHWFARALWHTMPFNYRKNFREVLKLGQLSQFNLQAFMSGDGKDFKFDYSMQGKLIVEDSKKHLFDDWLKAQYITAETGWSSEKFGRKKCIEALPFLEHAPHDIAGGVFSKNNHAGNCAAFCQELVKLLADKYDVAFTFNAPHAPLSHYAQHADAVVVACGFSAKSVLKGFKTYVPLYPVKGYSYDFERITPQQVYLTHKPYGFVMSDMGETTRVAGFADFVGLNTTDDATRKEALLKKVQNLFPNQKLKVVGEYMAFRPVTPNGLPIVRRVRKTNVFINTGHGMYGWTLAHGTAQKLADLVKKHIS